VFEWLGISAVNPWLLAGGAAIVSPILIHLLSRRRFKVVAWAAMEFLLDADQRNRRRIRLEHLILLLLRCLAVLLIALLVARPFLQPTGLGALAMQQVRTERIIVLDDSPSMAARAGSRTVMDQALATLSDFVRNTAAQQPGDTLTLLRMSRPAQPVIHGQYFEKSEQLIAALERISPSDVAADLPGAALAVQKMIDEADQSGAGAVNRVVYFVTDMRRADWPTQQAADDQQALANVLKRLGERVDGLVIADIGQAAEANLSVASVSPSEKVLTAGVHTQYQVSVVNHGQAVATDVPVSFTARNAPPLEAFIDEIPPGGQAVLPFSFTFREPGSQTISIELPPDVLPADNVHHFAAQVGQGVNVLIVDGDPSARFGDAESFYLNRALSPPGQAISGNRTEVISENQFGSIDLRRYQVIALCNVYQIAADQRQALRQWIERGGALIVAPGDQVDANVYNQQLFLDGRGVMPMRLIGTAGDLSERDWANLSVLDANHPITQVFAGANNPLIQQVKFFRYWMVEPAQLLGPDPASPRVIATFNNPRRSPAIIEQRLGEGRIIGLAMPLDNDWHTWPSDPSFVVTMLQTVRYLAPAEANRGNLIVGEPIVWPLDVSRFAAEARLTAPGAAEPTVLAAISAGQARGQATNGDGGPAELPDAGAPGDSPPGQANENPADPMDRDLVVRLDRTATAGVYELALNRYDGGQQIIRLAANIAPAEGDLVRADVDTLRREFEDSNVQLVSGSDYLAAGASGGRAELWRLILIMLVIVLCGEQFLAWAFGRRR
jgi:hypothetical protein